MANVLVKEETLTAIAESIRGKHGSAELYKPAEMPNAIDNIPVGDGPTEDDPVRFYGLEGKLLYSYSLEEVMELTELPTIPKSEGLIAQGWNWTLESIQHLKREVNVGAIYITDDGATRIYVDLREGMLNPILGFGQDKANSVYVDWGDGSELETTEQWGYANPVNMQHQYEKPGKYVIRLIPQDDVTKIYFLGDSRGSVILRKETTASDSARLFLKSIEKIEIGKQVRISSDGVCWLGIKNIVIPEDILYIAEGFGSCYQLEYIALPRSITILPSYTFNYCYSLKIASVPDTLTTGTTYAFNNNYSLKSLTFPDTVKNMWSYVVQNCYSLKRMDIPKGVTSVGASTFEGCFTLEEVIIPEGVTHIEGSAFENCLNLEHLDIPEGVTQFGASAFYNCSALKELKLPNSLETITVSALRNCYSLAELTIPENVTSIGAMAFSDNYGIENYYFLPIVPPTLGSNNVFNNISNTCKIHVPKGCLEAYQTAEYWSEYAEYMVEMEE